MLNSHQQSAPASELAGFVPTGEWLDRHPSYFYPTRSSLDWFIKQHRQELIEAGALITRAGRAGSLLSVERFPQAVLAIFKRQALQKAALDRVAG